MIRLNFKNQYLVTLMHLLGIITLLFLPFYLVNFKTANDRFFIYGIYMQTLVYGVFFYLNYLWFVPRMLFRKQYGWYAISILVTGTLLFMVLEKGYGIIFQRLMAMDPFKDIMASMDKVRVKIPPFKIHIYSHLVTSTMVVGFSTGIRMIGKLIQNEREKKELEKKNCIQNWLF